MSNVIEFISQFASDTRHKQHLEPDTTLLIKKFLATQAPIVDDFTKVYPFVADDMSRIEFRAPNQLQRYNTGILLEKGLLDNILQSATVNVDDKESTIFKDFCNVVNPKKGLELLSFFLHGQRNKNLASLVPSNELFGAIRDYKPPIELSENAIASEIGLLISGLQFDNPDWEYQEIDCDYTKEDEKEKGFEDEEMDDDFIPEIEDPVAFTKEHEKALRNNPVMIAFKKDNKISHQYPSVKVAKQIILSNVYPLGSHLTPIMGRNQSIDTFKKHPITDDILSIVDHIDSETIKRILQTPQARLYIQACNVSNPSRQTVKDLLSTHYLQDQPRYLKRTSSHVNSEICDLILNCNVHNKM